MKNKKRRRRPLEYEGRPNRAAFVSFVDHQGLAMPRLTDPLDARARMRATDGSEVHPGSGDKD
jgi:hypothetical protein